MRKARIAISFLSLLFLLLGCDFFLSKTTSTITTNTTNQVTTIETTENQTLTTQSTEDQITTTVTTLTTEELTTTTTESSDQVPIYQGMEIYNSLNSFSLSLKSNPKSSDIFDTSRPIKELIEEDLNISNSSIVEYFAKANEDVYLVIRIFNPDGQAILRFTLNGTVYQSFQFHEGSDSENLILKVNAGNTSGIKEFTIDEIKYVENETNDIKDAIFDGNQTIKLGVEYENLPYANLSDSHIGGTTFSFNVSIIDFSSLINENGGILRAYLYDGISLVNSKDLNIGENIVEFNKLEPNKAYQYVIATAIDVFDGSGLQVRLISTPISFATLPLVNINPLSTSQTAIDFSIDVIDDVSTGSITAIDLYKNDNLVEAISDLSQRTFTNLLSNNIYQIKVTYVYNTNDDLASKEFIAEYSFKTLEKAIPSIDLINLDLGKDYISFDFSVNDSDEVGDIIAIELYQGGILVDSLDKLDLRFFSNLLSNTEYTVKVTYSYDLNDGEGVQEINLTQTLKTIEKATPVITFNDVVPSQDSISFNFTTIDADEVGNIVSIELYQEANFIATLENLEIRLFNDLLSNTEYTLRLSYSYDLNDGMGAQDLIYTHSVTTLLKQAPTVNIIDYGIGNNLLTINFDIEDFDNTLVSIIYELYLGENLIESNLDNNVTFNNISSNNDYTLKVIYNYDLNDGFNLQTNEIEFDISTGFFGLGTEGNPYEIYNRNDLSRVGDYSDAYFVLKNDINLSDSPWEPITSLTSNLDGQFYKIIGLNINYVEGVTNYGLFGNINMGYTLKNLIIEDAQINIQATASLYVGILAAVNMGSIEQVGVTGNINVSTEWLKAAGLVASHGGFTGSKIINSYAIVDMVLSAVTRAEAGGLIAISSGPVYNSYAKGNIRIENEEFIDIYAGGLIAFHNTGEVVNSFSFVDFTVAKTAPYKTTRVGFLIGHTNSGTSLYNSYGFQQQQFVTDNPDFTPYDWKTIVIDVNLVSSDWISTTLAWDDTIWYYNFITSGLNITPLLTDPLFICSNIDVQQESVNMIFFISQNIISNSLIISIYKEDILINSFNDLTDITFDQLLSNTEYNVEVYFEYSFVNDTEILVLNEIYSFKTQEKTIPSLEIINIFNSEDSIQFEISIDDIDAVGMITAIELYQGDILIQSLSDLNIRIFTNLFSNTEYEIRVTYTYNLNDGLSYQISTYNLFFNTLDEQTP